MSGHMPLFTNLPVYGEMPSVPPRNGYTYVGSIEPGDESALKDSLFPDVSPLVRTLCGIGDISREIKTERIERNYEYLLPGWKEEHLAVYVKNGNEELKQKVSSIIDEYKQTSTHRNYSERLKRINKQIENVGTMRKILEPVLDSDDKETYELRRLALNRQKERLEMKLNSPELRREP